jgi:hypothetical protein
VHHQWSDALKLDGGGFRFPKRFPVAFHEWLWRSADELPIGRDRRGEDIYREKLDGHPARQALESLGAAFALLRSILEPGSVVPHSLLTSPLPNKLSSVLAR